MTANAELRVPPRRHSRLRRGAVLAFERLACGLGGRALYRRNFLSAGKFRVRRERIVSELLPPPFDGFTIVQLSDLHAGAFLASGDLSAVVRAANACSPDLVAITGDLITRHWTEALTLLDDLARLEAPDGVLVVFGNHDYKDRAEGRIVEAYARRGLRCLRNERVCLERSGSRLSIVGLEDLEESREVDLDQARAGLGPDEPEVVLCHHPRGALGVARRGCLAVLSGHTHGMQLDLRWLRDAGPAHPGLRIELGTTTLVVSRGLGVIGIPWRVRAPSELVVVRLERGGA